MDTVNRHGTLLEGVQVLTDLNLVITKAYISRDGVWFMDGKLNCLLRYLEEMITLFLLPDLVFQNSVLYVTGNDGSKVEDESVLNYIQKVFDMYLAFPLFITEKELIFNCTSSLPKL